MLKVKHKIVTKLLKLAGQKSECSHIHFVWIGAELARVIQYPVLGVKYFSRIPATEVKSFFADVVNHCLEVFQDPLCIFLAGTDLAQLLNQLVDLFISHVVCVDSNILYADTHCSSLTFYVYYIIDLGFVKR